MRQMHGNNMLLSHVSHLNLPQVTSPQRSITSFAVPWPRDFCHIFSKHLCQEIVVINLRNHYRCCSQRARVTQHGIATSRLAPGGSLRFFVQTQGVDLVFDRSCVCLCFYSSIIWCLLHRRCAGGKWYHIVWTHSTQRQPTYSTLHSHAARNEPHCEQSSASANR